MDVFQFIALATVLSTSSALIAYKQRYVQSSTLIFICALALAAVSVTLLKILGHEATLHVFALELSRPELFPSIVVEGMLSYLLFAGCIHLDTQVFQKHIKPIFLLAIGTTLTAIALHTYAFYGLSHWLMLAWSFKECLLLSVAISPTDPVAVLDLLKRLPTPKSLSVLIAGESLFNDGVALVLFTVVKEWVQFDTSKTNPHLGVLAHLTTELGVTLCVGLLMAVILRILVAYTLTLRQNDKHKACLLATLLSVNLNYLVAKSCGVSPALSVVVFGLLSSNILKALPEAVKQSVYMIWDTIDEVLNALLFFLVGLEVLMLLHAKWSMLLIFSTLIITATVRLMSVYIPLGVLYLPPFSQSLPKHTRSIVALGGLKGGLSLAMILSLSDMNLSNFNLLVAVTFITVASTLLLQSTALRLWLRVCYEAPGHGVCS